MGSAPFAAMSLPEGHAASFPQSLPGPTLQHPGGLSGGFSFRSSPQLLGSMVRPHPEVLSATTGCVGGSRALPWRLLLLRVHAYAGASSARTTAQHSICR